MDECSVKTQKTHTAPSYQRQKDKYVLTSESHVNAPLLWGHAPLLNSIFMGPI